RVAVHLHLMREAAVHAVVAQQVRVGLDRAEIVDGDDVDVLAAGFIDGAQDVAADATETVDGNSDSHVLLLGGGNRRFCAPARPARVSTLWLRGPRPHGAGYHFPASRACAALAAASAVMPKCG